LTGLGIHTCAAVMAVAPINARRLVLMALSIHGFPSTDYTETGDDD